MNIVYHKRGDTLLWNCQYTNPDGSPVDLTGYVIKAQFRDKSGTLIYDFSPLIAVTDTANGLYTINAPAAATSPWPIVDGEFDIEYTNASGVVTSTETGTLSVVKDITRAN